MVNWKLQPAEAEESTALDGVHPVVVKLLKQRGVTEEAVKNFLTPSYDRDIHDPFLFSQMEKAVARIGVAKERGERIVIFGDYDADGVTSSAVLKRALDDLGAISEVYIPSKELEGYGMNVAAVDQLATTDIKLIITVDCGITNVEEVERANSHGLDVIITDHHHVPKKVPAAYAIINPKVEGCGYPFSSLAGVGVAFKLAQALYAKFMPEQAQQLKWLLDFVAIGTIADCVPLIDENRTIAKYGLIVLGKTRSVGLQEMFQVGRIAINEEQLPTSHQVSFQIAPRLNAAGRMGHANIAYNLIAGVNRVEARDHALDLEAKNQERQKVTERVVEEVRVLVRNAFKDKPFIFAVGEHFPSGILGLAAGRVADEFGKPTAIFQKG
ncbi:single-stranded-DNA-specific exonuclease RecJ, partial [Patescibacteria group bacterium]